MKIPPFRLRPEPLTEQAANLPGFKWADPEVGKRHQLGGDPNWIQQPERPRCPTCGQEMTFYGQLDSINDDICLADAGIVYVFICFDDIIATALIQSG